MTQTYDWLPADWRIVEWPPDNAEGNRVRMVYRPGQTALMTIPEAFLLRDILTTSSGAHNRRPTQ